MHGSSRPTGGRVLIVDDNVDAAWALAARFRMEGWEAREEMDGARAVDAAVEMRPDAIVMDIAMPNVDGLEAAAAIRRLLRGPGMPRLVALTGYGTGEQRRRILEGGFDACVDKPAQFDSLLAALRG